MIFLLVLLLAGAYVASVTIVARRPDGWSLWIVAIVFLLAINLSAVLVGSWYHVPSVLRVVIYALTLGGPAILVPTVLLWYTKVRGVTPRAFLPIALVGTVMGLGCGFVLVVYGLRVW